MVKNMREIQWTCVWILSGVKNTPNAKGARARAAHGPPAANCLPTNPPNTRSPSKSYTSLEGTVEFQLKMCSSHISQIISEEVIQLLCVCGEDLCNICWNFTILQSVFAWNAHSHSNSILINVVLLRHNFFLGFTRCHVFSVFNIRRPVCGVGYIYKRCPQWWALDE